MRIECRIGVFGLRKHDARAFEPHGVRVGKPRRDFSHVLAAVAPLGERHDLAAGLEIAQPDRHDEDVHLPPGVVHVELARDARAGELEELRERVAVGGAAAMADVERPGRICRDELDLDGFGLRRSGAPVVRAFVERAPDDAELGLGLDPDIEKAGARHGERLEQARCRQRRRARLGDLLGDLPRVAPQALGELQRDVARVIAVLRVRRALDREGDLFG